MFFREESHCVWRNLQTTASHMKLTHLVPSLITCSPIKIKLSHSSILAMVPHLFIKTLLILPYFSSYGVTKFSVFLHLSRGPLHIYAQLFFRTTSALDDFSFLGGHILCLGALKESVMIMMLAGFHHPALRCSTHRLK